MIALLEPRIAAQVGTDYSGVFEASLETLKLEGRYRVFNELERPARGRKADDAKCHAVSRREDDVGDAVAIHDHQGMHRDGPRADLMVGDAGEALCLDELTASPAVDLTPYVTARGMITADVTGNAPLTDVCFAGTARL